MNLSVIYKFYFLTSKYENWEYFFFKKILINFSRRTYPVFAVGENYTPGSGQYYTSGNTAVTYTQVAQTGQSLITGSTYLIQPTVDHESAHTIITGSRTSPDTVNAVRNLKF